MNGRWRETAAKDSAGIERDLEETRSDMEATLEALEHKFSREHLRDITVGRLRQRSGEIAHHLGNTMNDNAVPLILMSIGVAWLFINRRGPVSHGEAEYSTDERLVDEEPIRERWAEVQESARNRFEQTREKLSHAAGSVRDRTRLVTEAGVARARSGAGYLLDEQPLVLGAIGIAIGALIGAALPPTEHEDRIIGSTRDRAFDKAKQAGTDAYRKARARAENIVEPAKSPLRSPDAATSSAGSQSPSADAAHGGMGRQGR